MKKKYNILFLLAGILLFIYTAFSYFKIMGFKLLSGNSFWGWVYLISYRYTFILAMIAIGIYVFQIKAGHKARGKDAE